MSEATTRLRIARMAAEITGIRTPYQQIPRVLQDAELPGLVVFPGAATNDKTTFGNEINYQIRTYELVLYLQKAQFDTEGQGQLNVDPFFDAVTTHYLARPGLEIDAEGAAQSENEYDSMLLGDDGLQVGPYPISGPQSPDYLQIRFRLQVKELAGIVYQD